MNEMLEVLVARDYDRCVGVILQRYPGPADGSACPRGASVPEGLHTSFTYDFNSRQNVSLMRSMLMQDRLFGDRRVDGGHISSALGRAGLLADRITPLVRKIFTLSGLLEAFLGLLPPIIQPHTKMLRHRCPATQLL
jgi:hypothetical protein